LELVDFVPWVFAALGPALIFLGIRSLGATSRFHKRAQRALGVITQIRWDTTGESRSSHPVVRFSLPDGRTVETEARHGSGPGSEGDQVAVLYDPANPTDIRLGGMLGSGHMTGVVMIFIGVIFFFLGAGLGTIFLLVERATS